MKLSMWMIANRLTDFSMDLRIREDAPVILRSARRVYSTNCVHVYQDGKSVVCAGEGDFIRLHNISLAEGFEIIQSIFDFYEDWAEALEQEIRKRDYQRVVEVAWQMFHNPMLMMDGNGRVLGLTRQYPADSVDGEWEYVSTYGYGSVNVTQQAGQALTGRGLRLLPGRQSETAVYGGAYYGMYSDKVFCGRLTVLEKDGKLNRGHYQLLEYIGLHLEPVLGHSYARDMMSNVNVFHQLLFSQPYDQTDLDFQLQYQNWKRDDVFSLAVLEISPSSSRGDVEQDTNIIMHVIMSQTHGCAVLRRQNSLLLLANRYLAGDSGMRLFFQSLRNGNSIKVSFSLPCRGIENAGLLYKQAAYAMEAGKREHPKSYFYDCFQYAVDYILESASLKEALRACMPTVYRLWEMEQQNGTEQFQTLKVFLENERSVSKTSEALFTHRNTVIYRLKKIEEILKHSLDDPYVRQYCRLSIQILELYHKRYPNGE